MEMRRGSSPCRSVSISAHSILGHAGQSVRLAGILRAGRFFVRSWSRDRKIVDGFDAELLGVEQPCCRAGLERIAAERLMVGA